MYRLSLLNKKTVKNRYPLPLPKELFDQMWRSKVFSKVDLWSGYWQMPLKTEDIHKTAFKTRWGLYEFSCHQHHYRIHEHDEQLLGKYLDKFDMVLLDDALIHYFNPQNHAELLQKI